MPSALADYHFDLNAYCARIGYDGPRTPTLATLQSLCSLHPAAITFEAIDVLLDRGVDISPAAVDAKLIRNRRGGYCYEQNSLLKRALVAMGFDVESLLARVRWMLAEDAPLPPRSHMVLRVVIDGEPWLADVGFGVCTPTSPLRLTSDEPQTTAHESFRLTQTEEGHALEALLDSKWSTLYLLSRQPQLDVDYLQPNWYTATHPSSQFRQKIMIARTTPSARYTLLNDALTIRTAGKIDKQQLSPEQIMAALRNIFNLPVEESWLAMIKAVTQKSE